MRSNSAVSKLLVFFSCAEQRLFKVSADVTFRLHCGLVGQLQLLLARTYFAVGYACKLVQFRHVFHTLFDDGCAVLCKANIPHVKHIVKVIRISRILQKIVLLFQGLVVVLQGFEITLLLLRKPHVQKSSSFRRRVLHQFQLVRGEEHNPQNSQKFPCSLHGYAVNCHLLFAHLVNEYADGVLAEFLFNSERHLCPVCTHADKLLILCCARTAKQ